MFQALIPGLLFDVISKVVQQKISDPTVPMQSEAPITAGREVASEVVQEIQNHPQLREVAPKSKWQSRGMIGALVAGLAGVAGALGFVIAPEEVDAIVGLISNGIVVVGAVMAWIGRKNATRPIA